MSLSKSLAPLRRLGAHEADDLNHRLAELTKQVSSITASLRHEGSGALDEASHAFGEFAEDVAHRLKPIALRVERQAVRTGRMLRNDPAPAVIAIGTMALLAALILARR